MLLGVVALRPGRKIEYDAANMRVTNVPAANQYLEREPRRLDVVDLRTRYRDHESTRTRSTRKRALFVYVFVISCFVVAFAQTLPVELALDAVVGNAERLEIRKHRFEEARLGLGAGFLRGRDVELRDAGPHT